MLPKEGQDLGLTGRLHNFWVLPLLYDLKLFPVSLFDVENQSLLLQVLNRLNPGLTVRESQDILHIQTQKGVIQRELGLHCDIMLRLDHFDLYLEGLPLIIRILTVRGLEI